MTQRKRSISSLRRVITFLVLLSAALFLLPRRWTQPLMNLVQVLVPFQDAASSAIQTGKDAISGAESDPSELEVSACENQVGALSMRILELESELDQLTATRFGRGGFQGLGPRGRLIPARVLTSDMLPWRDSRLISAGTFQGVQGGLAVTSAHFTLSGGESGGHRSGLAIVLAETFLGWVDQVGTHTSRVRLISDVGVSMKVRIGRLNEQEFAAMEGYYWMVGKGRGTLEIADIDRRNVEAGHVLAGDVVLSDAESTSLPAAMRIGTIARIDPDRDHPLLAIATVETAVDPAALRRVYIYDPQSTGE